MNLSDLIERNAAFTPDKTAIIFEGEAFSYRALHDRIEQAARALKAEFGVNRGDRVAILSLNRPDYLVLLYACARLDAILPELEKSLPTTSIVGLDFAPPRGSAFDTLLAQARGDGHHPYIDLSCPLLIVYTYGTTGRPKGAVLR